MNKLNNVQEIILRKQIAVAKETIEECNKLLVDGGCEPEPDTMLKSAKVVTAGAIEKTARFFGSIKDTVVNAYDETKKAGSERIIRKEIDKQVEDQMKSVRDQLHAAVGASK